jgi:hypothetical protein
VFSWLIIHYFQHRLTAALGIFKLMTAVGVLTIAGFIFYFNLFPAGFATKHGHRNQSQQ